MLTRTRWLIVAALLLASTGALAGPPPTRVAVVSDTLHGTAIEDPYRWLEDKDAPATRAWLDQQIRYTKETLGNYSGRTRLVTRLAQLLKVDAVTTPVERGGRYFFSKRAANQDQRVLCVRQGVAGPDEVLVDPHPLSADHSTSVNYLDESSDGSLVAVGTRQGGRDEVVVSFVQVATRKPLADALPLGRYFGIQIGADDRGVYYSRSFPDGARIFYHAFGAPVDKDAALFGEGYGGDKIIDLLLSDDGRRLLFTVYYGAAAERSELWVMDTKTRGPATPIVKDIDAFFGGEIAGDQLYLRTTWKAAHGRIVRVDLNHPATDAWREVVPEGPHALVDFSLAGGRVFASYLEDVASKVRVFGPDGRRLGEIAFPTLGTVSGINGRWSSNEAFFTFSSFVVPPTIYRFDIPGGVRTEWWRSSAPVVSARYVTEQVWTTSRDGTRVPMFLVHRKGLELDGKRPVLLTGYGGFDVNETPSFSPEAVIFAESGGVYALPNLRGGAEFGEDWHRAGMLEQKQHTFDDFIAAAEWLVGNQYTDTEHLSILGGSNGGLLVGAFMTQRPDLCRAAICAVPLLDMLRYHRFLVARFWVPEYGSADDPSQFQFIYDYSPYQHVVKGTEYPAVMFVSGDSDTRVDPLHARKMTALMQAATGSDPLRRPVLLHYDTKSGHAGGKPVGQQIEDNADQLLFLFEQLGMNRASGPVDTPVGGVNR